MPSTSPVQCNAQIEIACFNIDSVLIAAGAGADRMEFCAERASGGITPSLSALQDVKAKCTKPIYVMIRPRGGDFVYTDAEFAQMKNDMHNFISAGGTANGFVFGILDSKNQIDLHRNAELIALAHPLPCTFHRAFDETEDMEKALEDVIACGFQTILTSGGARDAVAGAEALKKLVASARDRVQIMPGGGLRSSNIEVLMNKTKAKWYHSAAILDDGDHPNKDEIKLFKAATLQDE